MIFSFIPFSQQKKSKWAGGNTFELFIYPANAIYSERDFEFRISSASVETETSEFTSLPNYTRHLMVLEGEMQIIHQDHYSKKLNQFDLDEFSGAWKTTSLGKVIDFNLMLSEKWEGSIQHLSTKNKQTLLFSNCDYIGIYLFNGKASVHQIKMEEKDFLIVDTISKEEKTLSIEPSTSCELVVVRIWKIN